MDDSGKDNEDNESSISEEILSEYSIDDISSRKSTDSDEGPISHIVGIFLKNIFKAIYFDILL